MNKLTAKLFKGRLTDQDNMFVNMMTLASIIWLATALSSLSDNVLSYFVYAIPYILLAFLVYFLIRKRIEGKLLNPTQPAKIACISVMITQNLLLIYLYSFEVFSTMSSLLISIPVSLIITFICVECWVRFSKKS